MGPEPSDRPSRLPRWLPAGGVRSWIRRRAGGLSRPPPGSLLAMLAVAALPLWLARAHWRARWPWSGDGVSMTLPTSLARRALADGRVPTWSPLYFQGEPLSNPHSQLLYPPWWVTLAPIALGDALKLVLGAHFVAAPLVAYWYARRADLSVPVAAGIGVAAAMPLAGLAGHHQKVLGWPWLLLLAGQLLPWEFEDARRSGAVVGVAGGALLLASSLYYAWYGAVFVAPLFVLYRDRERWTAAVAGAAVGLPALALNVVPYLGAPRPPPGWWLTPWTVLTGLVGLAPGESRRVGHGGPLVSGVPFEGYAAVGAVVVVLGVAGLALAVADGRRRWAAGVAAGGGLGVVLATQPPVYRLPAVDAFRTAGRANVLVALALLVFSVYACRRLSDPEFGPASGVDSLSDRLANLRSGSAAGVALSALLLVNAAQGALAWRAMDAGTGTDLAESRAFAAELPDCGGDVWVETYQNGSVPRGHLGTALLRAGYRLDAVYYAAIGASYDVRTSDGDLAFDLLVVPTRIDGREPLTGGSAGRVRGTVSRAELRYLGARRYRGATVHLYARRGACDR